MFQFFALPDYTFQAAPVTCDPHLTIDRSNGKLKPQQSSESASCCFDATPYVGIGFGVSYRRIPK
eukprot:4221508-Amphidinium_carterae.1